MTASFLHYISLFLSVFFVTNKMRLPWWFRLLVGSGFTRTSSFKSCVLGWVWKARGTRTKTVSDYSYFGSHW